jgi:prepilin-type N-terminal cleavage/methylation domain-containing protein
VRAKPYGRPGAPERGDVRSNRGFTLVEAVIVIVVIGLLGVLAFPRLSQAMSKSDLRSARTTMVNLVAAARAASVATNRATSLQFDAGKAYVTATPRWTVGGAGTIDTVGPIKDLAGLYKVAVTPPTVAVQFDPRGFGSFGAIDSIVLVRGSYREVISIDGLGRIRK